METLTYSIHVGKGNACWLVQLTNPDPGAWVVLGSRPTKVEALRLAKDIHMGVLKTKPIIMS